MTDIEVETLLEHVAKEEGFCHHKIETGAGNAKGEGYFGVVNEVRIVGKDRENKDKALNLIVKIASKSDDLRNSAPLENLYSREIYMYDVVFPAFKNLEIGKGLIPSMFAPTFYKGHLIYRNEILILENLKKIGYKLYERRKPMNEDHVDLVMAEYGRFHALSFAMRDQNSETFKTTIAPMDDVFIDFLKKANFLDTLTYHSTKVHAALDIDIYKEAAKVYQTFASGIEPFFDELLETSPDNYSVVLHGDCWTNNMLFKYEDSDDVTKPTKVCFIDFQLSRPGPPVLDLAYFLYACSSKEILNKLDHYLDLYYNSLSLHLLKLGSDPDKLFPHSVFQQQWTRYARYGLIVAAPIIHIMLSEKDETVDLADVAESGISIKDAFNYEISNVDAYNDRIRHIIMHFVENGLI